MGLIDYTKARMGDDVLDYFPRPRRDHKGAAPRAASSCLQAKQTALRNYIQSEFNAFPPYTYVHIGWNTGAKREAYETAAEAGRP